MSLVSNLFSIFEKGFTIRGYSQPPKRRDFERDSYKMALEIASAENFCQMFSQNPARLLGKEAVPIPLYVLEVSIVQKKEFFHS
jgi:hypothetical protein